MVDRYWRIDFSHFGNINNCHVWFDVYSGSFINSVHSTDVSLEETWIDASDANENKNTMPFDARLMRSCCDILHKKTGKQ